MRRMIPQILIDWIKGIKEHLVQNGNTTEVGGNMEVDGDIKVNGVENLTDKEGNPLPLGTPTFVDTEEIVHDDTEEGVEFHLAQEVSNKVQNSLQLPLVHTEEKIVAVNTAGAQEMLGIGQGLAVVDGNLQASGGGGGGGLTLLASLTPDSNSVNITQYITDRSGAALYVLITQGASNSHKRYYSYITSFKDVPYGISHQWGPYEVSSGSSIFKYGFYINNDAHGTPNIILECASDFTKINKLDIYKLG